MTDPPESPRAAGSSVHLAQLSVVLVANQVDPSILNPDFLRHNRIVDPDAQVGAPSVSTPQLSQVTFQDGIAVKANHNRVIFEEADDPLRPDCVRSPSMAIRFVTLFPNILYKAIGINPVAIPFLDGAVDERVAIQNALVDKGQWLRLGEQSPKLGLRTVYRLQDRTVFLEILDGEASEADAHPPSVVAFRSNIHRDLDEPDHVARNQRLLSVLAKWEDDLKDFEQLIGQFLSWSTTQ